MVAAENSSLDVRFAIAPDLSSGEIHKLRLVLQSGTGTTSSGLEVQIDTNVSAIRTSLRQI